MKKRMFLSTILMTLVLLVAVTTATFAWYSATSGVTKTGDNVQMTTSNATFALGNGEIKIEFGTLRGTPGPTNTDGEIFVSVNGVIPTIPYWAPGSEDEAPYDSTGNVEYTITVTPAEGMGLGEFLLANKSTSYTINFTEEGGKLRFAGNADAAVAQESTYSLTISINAEGGLSIADSASEPLEVEDGSASGTLYFAVNSEVEVASSQYTISAAFAQ